MEDKTVELQFITHFTDTYSYYDSARMALEGGCRWIQLRMKDTPVDEVEREAIRLQGLCKDYGATFIIDDHVELVKKIHADGVHLGKKDMPVAEARGILGKEFITLSNVTNESEFIDKTIKEWLENVEPAKREQVINVIFEILNSALVMLFISSINLII